MLMALVCSAANLPPRLLFIQNNSRAKDREHKQHASELASGGSAAQSGGGTPSGGGSAPPGTASGGGTPAGGAPAPPATRPKRAAAMKARRSIQQLSSESASSADEAPQPRPQKKQQRCKSASAADEAALPRPQQQQQQPQLQPAPADGSSAVVLDGKSFKVRQSCHAAAVGYALLHI